MTKFPRVVALLAAAVVMGSVLVASPAPVAQAGVFFNSEQYTYKEYWASHDTYTAGCGEHATAGGSWYIEPSGCVKSIDLQIPDDVSGAIAAVVYVDVWRNRVSASSQFTINNGPQIKPPAGSNFSRNPFSASVPLPQLQQGSNIIRFQESSGAYHVHDVMIRVYYDAANPIVPGPGSDVTPPSGALTSVGGIAAGVGGVINVDNNKVVLKATASDAAYVEFHAYYDGFDEDNDGVTRDWHNFLRNNYGPGGTEAKLTGATIGHIGTDSTSPYEVTWNLPHVVSQSGVKFKIRVVDAAGNVVEAPGGVSADFTLSRSYSVETYTIPNFQDQALYFNNTFPQSATDSITLPTDLNGATRAMLLGNYWNSPDISLNGNTPFPAFVGNEDQWATSVRELDIGLLRPGANTITWNYNPPGFGAMVERPGPMIVIHRALPTGAPVITTQPSDAFVEQGHTATFFVTASGSGPFAYQWMRDGLPIAGATSSSYTTPALFASDSGSRYSVHVTNALDTATSSEGTAYVAGAPGDNAPWWDDDWSFRVPLTVASDPVARTDKVVSQVINFSSLMTAAGAGGPSFDPNSIRVVEVDAGGAVIDASVPFQFDPANVYNAASNAVGTLVWQLEGVTPRGATRTYYVYFDKASRGIPAVSFPAQVTRTDSTDEGRPAYRFDLADGSKWYFHTKDGGGFSSIVDREGNDWLNWSSATGDAGDFRGFPNATKPPLNYFHPGRNNATVTRVLHEGPLRITFESRSSDDKWVMVWSMYPTHADFTMQKANGLYWVLYEGTPGGEFDSNDFIRRADGLQVGVGGTFESDIAGDEWMYAADPSDGRSFFMAHHQDDGSVESYKQQSNQMTVLGFGRGGNNLNFPYMTKLFNGKPHSFSAGLADSTEPVATEGHILSAYKSPAILVGQSSFNGIDEGPVSDSFNAPALDPMWTVVNPGGVSTVSMTGTALQLDLPSGPPLDLWAGRLGAPRVMQPVGDVDLDVAVGFTAEPTQAAQGHGLLFWQDDDNWVRAAVVFTGGKTYVDLYKMTNGSASRVGRKQLAGSAATHLRVTRAGNTWTVQHSWNGTKWFASTSATVPLDLNAVGPYATSYQSSSSPGFLTGVDYFASLSSSTPVDLGPTITNFSIAPSSRGAVVTWNTNVPATTRLDHGATIQLQDQVVDTTLTTEHSVELGFLACGAPHFVRPLSADALGSTTGPMTSFVTEACSPIVSDDFSTGSLGSQWTFVDPVGDVVFSQTNTNVLMSIPAASNHNLFPGQNLAARLRQAGPVGNFGVEAKFESVLSRRFQMQGIVVEQSDDSFLRFEIHHDGTRPRAYVASVDGGVVSVEYYENVTTSMEYYLRVQRAGDSWTVSYSVDDLVWEELVTFESDIESVYVGPYIGTTETGTATPPAFIGSIDYFFNLDTPLDPDDGGAGPDVVPPVISGLTATTGVPSVGNATISWATDEPSTTRVDWGSTAAYGLQSIDNVAVINHSATIGPLNCGQTYHYRAQSNDASGNIATSGDRTFTMPACGGGFSDNFDADTLDSRWFVNDPRGDGTITPVQGLLTMSVPAGQRHDLTSSGKFALRLLQPVNDTDFQVQVGFESVVGFASQIQGVVFEQDNSALVRFDLSSDGSTTRAYVGHLRPVPPNNNQQLAPLANVAVNGAVPGTLRVTRTGQTWTFEYSSDDGGSWQEIWSGVIAMSVARMGPYAGNANPQAANVPDHTAFVDYFWTSTDPITITDPGVTDGPMYSVFGGNGVAWNGEPLYFGSNGLTQPDVNIMGRVLDPDGVVSATYSLNGGAPVRLGLGSTNCAVGVSCTRRLAANGDFNADIDASKLVEGANTVRIRAVDGKFNVSTIDIPVVFTSGQQWPTEYSVDWNSVSDLYTSAQPIDGRWVVNGDTVRTQEIGYDRLLGLGDRDWGSFEVEVPITINSVDAAGYAAPSGGPGIGFIPHWRGHTPVGTVQPKYGFQNQLGALVWYRYRTNGERFEIRNSQASVVAEDLTGRKLSVGVQYIYKLQAQTGSGNQGPTYRLKVWEAGTAEPAAWDLVSTLPAGSPDTGSLALVAHHVDATFGDISVNAITLGAPAVSPASGTYNGVVEVSMAAAGGGTVRYTLDGSTPTASSPLYTAPFLVSSTTTVKARAFSAGVAPSSVVERTYQMTGLPSRVTAGLAADYRFDEGSGTRVLNSVPGGSALDLSFAPGTTATWLPDVGALRLSGSSLVRTSSGATTLNNAIKASQAMTVEMWVSPTNLNAGERTLLQIAPIGNATQNLAIVQNGTSLQVSLRTSTTDAKGRPVMTAPGVLSSGLHQIVVTRRANGVVEVYVDGAVVFTTVRGGTLSPWVAGQPFGFGNTIAKTSPWTGDVYHLSVYTTDLSAVQVAQNYLAGVGVTETPPPDTTVPDTTVPDTTVPDTTVPDTTVPDTTVPGTTVPDASRVTQGLVAFYPFNETSGATVQDLSGVASPLNLTISTPANTTRVPSGLRINSPTVIISKAATALVGAVQASNALTIEMWLEPAQAQQLDSMVVAMSVNKNARNFGIVRDGGNLNAHLRTAATNVLGDPPTSASGVSLVGLSHVVFTRAADGSTAVYVNGVQVATGSVARNLTNWATTSYLHLGGERDGSRPWLGTYYLLAVYDRALSAAEVAQNLLAGDV